MMNEVSFVCDRKQFDLSFANNIQPYETMDQSSVLNPKLAKYFFKLKLRLRSLTFR